MGSAVDTTLQSFASHVHRTSSASTSRKYEQAVRKFLKTLRFNNITRYEALPRNVLQLYADALIAQSYAPASIYVYLAGVRRYLSWVRNQGVKLPELAEPDLPKVPHRIRDVLSPDAMAVYFEQADELLPEPSRTAALLLPCTGLRAAEMAALPLTALHKVVVPLKDGTTKNTYALRVIGKGNKERSVPILDEGAEQLLLYLSGWRRKSGGPWVFPGMISKANKNGSKHMSVRSLRDAVARVREPLGMEVTPHTMRRTYLTSLWRMGVDPAAIAKIAGHANIQTLFKHYLMLDEHDVVSAVHSRI